MDPAADGLHADPWDLNSIKFPDKLFPPAYSQGIFSTPLLSAHTAFDFKCISYRQDIVCSCFLKKFSWTVSFWLEYLGQLHLVLLVVLL